MKRAMSLAALLALAACNAAPPPPTPTPEQSEQRLREVAEAVEAQKQAIAAAPAGPVDPASAYAISFDGLVLDKIPLSAYQGKVMLVVNTASKCGFTPQYTGLQALHTEFAPQGLVVIGVPANNFGGQEPGEAEEIRDFCTLNFGVTFPMAAKTDVVGGSAHPFYVWAQKELGDDAVPKWNFHKILVGKDGRAIRAFPSDVTPDGPEMRAAVSAALAATTPAAAASAG